MKVDETIKETKPAADEDEFTAMATSRSTPQPQPKGTSSSSSSALDDLMGLGSAWGSGAPTTGNNPWGGPSTTSFPPTNTNPFSVGGGMGGGSPNPWGGG